MTVINLIHSAVIVAFASITATTCVSAQNAEAIPNQSQTLAQTTPEAEGMQHEQGTQAQPGMMRPGMMMQRGMMGGMQMGGMHAHMMKVMFAIVDMDGDGALSFEEVTAVHKRIFAVVDVNKDGQVTQEELRDFMGQ